MPFILEFWHFEKFFINIFKVTPFYRNEIQKMKIKISQTSTCKPTGTTFTKQELFHFVNKESESGPFSSWVENRDTN